MAKRKTKLELIWIGKENRPKLEPRILIEDPELSYHASHRVSEDDIFDNRLIFGDNLLALKALEQEFAGKIKCIFIDPPYNTGSAFQQYDDGIEHSIWLGMMRDRLELLRRLLANDGSLWITIDDHECHYLKVLCDEVFGRDNFLADISWEKVYSERMDATGFSKSCDHILCYQRSSATLIHQLAQKQNLRQFNYFDESVQRFYRRRSLRKEGSESRRKDRPSMWYPIRCPDGTDLYPIKPDGTKGRWRWKQENVEARKNELDFVRTDNGWQIYVKQYAEDAPTRPPNTLWRQEDVGHNHEAKLEVQRLCPDDVFATPKPERLLQRIMLVASNPGDLVLDSFAGSGTTGAVAHKMKRRWIMIELEETCHTHIIPRLKKVIAGDDPGGITESVNWKGGGGFRYFKLGPSLLEKDQYGNWVISKEFNAAMLAEAMCKLEGFIYAPSDEVYWQHGYSTERDFIYVTTQTMTHEMLAQLSEEVGEHRSLLICCSAFRAKADVFPNLTLKKIPKAVMRKCEWGHDDYSLEVENLPKAPPALEEQTEDVPAKPRRKFGKGKTSQATLFDVGDDQ